MQGLSVGGRHLFLADEINSITKNTVTIIFIFIPRVQVTIPVGPFRPPFAFVH